MNSPKSATTRDLPVSDELLVDEICDSFEQAWKSGQRPQIEEHLEKAPSTARFFLLQELLLIEFHYRRDETISPDECSARFPDLDTQWLLRELSASGNFDISDQANAENRDKPDKVDTPPEGYPVSSSITDAMIGRCIGDYELLEEIGRGGMGVVYKARQASLNRLVAVKFILSGELASDKELQRFQIEAEAAANLDHPNIVPVYDFGEHDGHRYLAMKFVDGGSLAQVVQAATSIADDATTPAESKTSSAPKTDADVRQKRNARLVGIIARAVHHAHQHGILHRDLKPGNILLDSDGNPLVTDFGLAKRLQETTAVTGSNALLGTPAYIAPELMSSHRKRINTAADIYSLGAILYELLTGHPLFSGSAMEILRKAQFEEPDSPRTHDPAIQRDLEIICLKCLQKEPHARYKSAEELAQDLERFQRGDPILARSATTWERYWRWCRRNPALATMGMAVSLLLIVVAIGATTAAIVFQGQRNTMFAQKQAIAKAKREALVELAHSYLVQARATRMSGRLGQRVKTLGVLKKAIQLGNKLQLPTSFFASLRDEAIAAFALPDLEIAKNWRAPVYASSICFDAQFKRYAYWDTTSRLRIRKVQDNQEICCLTGKHFGQSLKNYGHNLVYSNDGTLIAILNERRYLQVWNVGTADPQKILEIEDGISRMRAIAISPDGNEIAVGLKDNAVAVYNLISRKQIRRFVIPEMPRSVAYHPGHTQLAVASHRAVRLFGLEDSGKEIELPLSGLPYHVAWHPDGTHLAVSTEEDLSVHIWNLAETRIVRTLKGLPRGTTIAFHPSGSVLATTGWDHVTRLWNWQLGNMLLKASSPSLFVQFSDDGRLVGPCLQPGKIGYWKVHVAPEHRVLVREKALDKGYYGVPVVSPNGRILFVSMNKGIAIWDIASGREMGFLASKGDVQGRSRGHGWVAISATGKLLTTLNQGTFRWSILHDPEAPHVICLGLSERLPFPLGGSVATSRDGKVAASATGIGAVVQHEQFPKKPAQLQPHRDCRYLAVSPDGRWIATGTHRGTPGVKIWQAVTGKLVKELIPVGNTANVKFSPDRLWLLVNQPTKDTTRLWRIGTWEKGPVFDDAGFGSIFSPDSSYLALGTSRGTIRLVDCKTKREIARLENPAQNRPEYCQYTPDGSKLIVVSRIGRRIHVWDLRLIGKQLEELGLKWELPAFPDSTPTNAKSLKIRIDWGSADSTMKWQAKSPRQRELLPKTYSIHTTGTASEAPMRPSSTIKPPSRITPWP